VGSRSLCQLLGATVITEGRLVALSVDWGFDEVVLPTAGPAEFEVGFGCWPLGVPSGLLRGVAAL
jgi:hypothetical protein